MTEESKDLTGLGPDLLVQHSQGNSEAFDQLVAAFRQPVFGYLHRCGLPNAVCQDLWQETFMRLHQSSHAYQPTHPLKVWVFTLAANVVRSYYRRQAAQRRVIADAPAEPATSEPTGLQLVEAREADSWLSDSVAKLPLLQREVLVLSCRQDLDQQTIAEILNIPVNSVKTNLRRARLALAKELSRRKSQGQREVAQ
jgi:RNA polymerase sigma-70 factor (ECF subfamily)